MERLIFNVVVGFVFGSLFSGAVLASMDSLMAHLQWLPGGTMTLALIGGSAFAIGIAIFEYVRLSRQSDLRKFARQRSLSFSEKGNEAIADCMNRLTAIGSTASLENEMWCQFNGLQMTVGDLSIQSSGKRDSVQTSTVAYFTGRQLYFPHFTLQREERRLNFIGSLVGVRDIDFASHPAFSSAYHLSSDAPDATLALFDSACLDYFNTYQGWEVRADRDGIMISRGTLIPLHELDRFISDSQQIASLFAGALQRLLKQPDLSPEITPEQTTTPFPASKEAGWGGQQLASSGDSRVAGSPPPDSDGVLKTRSSDEIEQSWLARRIAANASRWSGVELFLSNPPPRSIPKVIRRQQVGWGSMLGTAFLAYLALMGLAFLFLGAHAKDGASVTVGTLMALIAAAGISLIDMRSRRRLRILRDGRVIMAEIVSVRSTRRQRNGQPETEITIRYSVDKQAYLKSLRVRGAHGDLAQDAFDLGKPTPLLVDPRNPDRYLLGLQLTSSPRIRL